MNTTQPLDTLWQPGYLHGIDTLAQPAADLAIAAENPNAFDAIMRFCYRSFKLQKQLEPFTRHDLDRPNSWPPSASRHLLHGLLRLCSVLQQLPPEVGKQKWERRVSAT